MISRVSYLFRGHNNLIQGFNTFLPPGYRIECSLDPLDPNPIKVTTPRGTTSRPELPGIYDPRWNSYPQDSRQRESQKSPNQQQLGTDNYPNPSYATNTGPTDPNAGHFQQQTTQGLLHRPENNGQHAQNLLSSAGGPPVNQLPDGSVSQPDFQGASGAENRRPGDPVEFNYAINYVNKIKTRFANQPEIYNSFLEILQTYHRDQLRISEVYVQVTQLFRDAPDLLDDFKQFLPDMSQQHAQRSTPFGSHKMQPIHHDDNSILSAQQQQNLVHSADDVRLPPVGSFSPPNITNGPGSSVPSTGPNSFGPSGQAALMDMAQSSAHSVRGKKRNGNANIDNTIYQQSMGGYENEVQISNARHTANTKRSRINDNMIPSSPTLVPGIPEALDSYGNTHSTELSDEILFFDKAKRFISNKQTYNEFLKVLNLFTQRIIDKDLLVERVEGFLGGNRELMNWFKGFVRYEGKPLHIENIPYKKHLLELSLCRSYGRSYRLLPKSEPYMPCSGRDEMCWEVLNDEWVGHPVWASEEAGFVAHRKNQYEEIMHRVEEERHEYDYYIEANLRSIQTLETIATRIINMLPEEKASFKLPRNLGHTSTIYEKVLKKIYGEPRYHEVVTALHETPAVSVPIVLRRMKQKDEEWKRAHREWNKVWRDTEQKVFFKSLDHRGLTFKQTDKKYLTTRQLISEITTVKTEQSNKKISPLQAKPKEQLAYTVKDYDVLMDLMRVITCFLTHAGTYSTNDRERMETFFKVFLNLFFSVPEGMISFSPKETNPGPEGLAGDTEQKGIDTKDSKDIQDQKDIEMKGTDDLNEDTNSTDASGSKKRSHEPAVEMLRDILKKSKQAKRFRDDSYNGDDDEDQEEFVDDSIERNGDHWMKHQSSSVDLFEERHRNAYNLFANNTVYVFMRLLIILYERLEEVKGYEAVVSDEIANSRNVQFAIDLDLYDHRMADMGLAFESKNCYGQLLTLIERLIVGDLEHQSYEESIRQAYRNRAYKLYTVDKVTQAIVKHLHTIISDVKSSDVLVLWENDRNNPLTSTKEQIIYRTRVKSVLGPDENLFRIEWNDKTHSVMIQFLSNEDVTLKRQRNLEDGWNYYLTSYLMSGSTEGVPADKVRLPFLKRNLIDEIKDPDSHSGEKFDITDDVLDTGTDTSSNHSNHGNFLDIIDQGLAARVALPTFKMYFEPGTFDYFSRKVGVSSNTSTKSAGKQRQGRWESLLAKSVAGVEGFEETQSRYDAWKNKELAVELVNGTVADSSQDEKNVTEETKADEDEKIDSKVSATELPEETLNGSSQSNGTTDNSGLAQSSKAVQDSSITTQVTDTEASKPIKTEQIEVSANDSVDSSALKQEDSPENPKDLSANGIANLDSAKSIPSKSVELPTAVPPSSQEVTSNDSVPQLPSTENGSNQNGSAIESSNTSQQETVGKPGISDDALPNAEPTDAISENGSKGYENEPALNLDGIEVDDEADKTDVSLILSSLISNVDEKASEALDTSKGLSEMQKEIDEQDKKERETRMKQQLSNQE